MQEQLHVQHVLDVQHALDQQENVVVVIQVMVLVQVHKHVPHVHHYIIQQEERWYVQNVIHYVKHATLKQVIV